MPRRKKSSKDGTSSKNAKGDPEGGTRSENVKGEKRKIYLRKPDYYMGIALLAAQRSRDPRTQEGACIVNQEGRIVGIGYNGMPKQLDEEFTWNRDFEAYDTEDEQFKETKYAYVCHSVLNAIVNNNVRGCTIYAVLFPCNKCTELITQSGISKVVYLSDMYRNRQENSEPHEVTAGKTILDIAGIKCVKFDLLSARPEGKGIQIKLDNIDPKDVKEEQPIFIKKSKADPPQKDLNKCSDDYLSEGDFFMAVAKLSAERSKDKDTQVGACIVSEDNKVVGLGYNGMPNGCSDDVMHWGKKGGPLENKHLYVCHAELNAIMNRNCIDVKGCSMYVTLFPCNECAKLIVQSGIKKVIYLVDRPTKKEFIASRKILQETSGIEIDCQEYVVKKELFLDFDVMEKRIKKEGESSGASNME